MDVVNVRGCIFQRRNILKVCIASQGEVVIADQRAFHRDHMGSCISQGHPARVREIGHADDASDGDGVRGLSKGRVPRVTAP